MYTVITKGNLFVCFHDPIIHIAYPKKIYISIVFNFSSDLQEFQESLKQ